MAQKTYKKFSKKKLSKKNKLRKGKRKSLRSKVKNRKYEGGFWSMLDAFRTGVTLFLVDASDANKFLNNKHQRLDDIWEYFSPYLYYITFSEDYKRKYSERRRRDLEWRLKEKLKKELDPTDEKKISDDELYKQVLSIPENQKRLKTESHYSVLTSNNPSWLVGIYDIELDKKYDKPEDFMKDSRNILQQIKERWNNERRWNGRAEYFKDKDEYENIKEQWRNEKAEGEKNGKGGIYIDWKDNIYNHGYPVLIQDKALPNGKKYGYEVINADLINRMLQGRGLRQT